MKTQKTSIRIGTILAACLISAPWATPAAAQNNSGNQQIPMLGSPLAKENWQFTQKLNAWNAEIKQYSNQIQAVQRNPGSRSQGKAAQAAILIKIAELDAKRLRVQYTVQQATAAHNQLVRNLSSQIGQVGTVNYGRAQLPGRQSVVYGRNGGYGHVPTQGRR